MTKSIDGDRHLSGLDQKLWALHHHLVVHQQCYTFFKLSLYNCVTSTKGLIQWFVPRDHDQCFEITKWLEKEQTEDHDFGDIVVPGTDVDIRVMEFKGVRGYVDRDTVEQLATEALKSWKKMLEDREQGE